MLSLLSKRLIAMILTFCMLIGMTAMAENTAGSDNTSGISSERPKQGDFDPSQMPRGDFDPSKMPRGDFVPPEINESYDTQISTPVADNEIAEDNQTIPVNGEEPSKTQGENPSFGRQMPEGMGGFPGNMMQNNQNTPEQQTGFLGFVKTYSTPIVSVILLGLAYIFVFFYKRKHY